MEKKLIASYKFEDELKYIRSRKQIHENRRFQMMLLSVGGFATILSISDKIPHILIPIILFALIMVTAHVSIMEHKRQNFLNELIFEQCARYSYFPTLEEIYKSCFHNMAKKSTPKLTLYRDLFGGLFEQFSVIPIASYIASIFFSYDYLINIYTQETIFLKIGVSLVIIIISAGYLSVLCRMIEFRKQAISNRGKLKTDIRIAIENYLNNREL